MQYISKFSVTEKTIFAILVCIAVLTSMIMALKVSDMFKIDVPAYGGELNEGLIGLPHMINPVLAITDADRDITSLVYSGLMKYDGDSLVPDIAQDYKVSDDGLRYAFKIRPNIYFHDGSKLTTEDIAFTIQKIQNPILKSPKRADWNNVTIEIISPEEIVFVLRQPYAPFITNTTVGILPKHIWNNINDDQFVFSDYNIEPVGSGPYQFKNLTKDKGGIPTTLSLASSNKYYAKRPYIETINFSFFADEETAIAQLKSGTISSLSSISPDNAKQLEDAGYNPLNVPLPRIFGVFFNQNSNPVLAIKEVRQALDFAVDRKQIIDKGLMGYGLAITGPLPLSDLKQIENIPRSNPDLAKSLLEKNGWTMNKETNVYEKKGAKNTLQVLTFDLYTADTPDLKNTAQLLKEAWEMIGAKVNIKIYDASELYQNVIRPRKYDALLFGQQIGKDKDLYAYWHSSQRNAPGLNVAMYANSHVDDLLEKIRTDSDDKDSRDKYKELEKIIKNDTPAIFLYSPEFTYILPKEITNNFQNKKIINNITNPSDRWNSINDWYIKSEKVWKILK